MRYPKYLKNGNMIAFVAPSFGAVIEPYHSAFENALKKIENKGYKVQLGPNVYMSDGIGISTSPDKCGKELTDFYASSENDAIISAGGGEMMCETIDHVDFEKIKASEPKWFMGYSDNTNFEFLLETLCDTASIYGPCAATFGMEPWHESLNIFMDILAGKRTEVHSYDLWEKSPIRDESNPYVPFNLTEKEVHRIYVGNKEQNEANFSGRMVGGCLDVLFNLCGTKYDKVKEFGKKYAKDGLIWYLEACDLNVFSQRRAVWALDRAGWFENVSGFIIGRPYLFDDTAGKLDHYRAVTDILGKYNVPIVMDAPIGHLPPQMPVINGAIAEASANSDSIKLTYLFN